MRNFVVPAAVALCILVDTVPKTFARGNLSCYDCLYNSKREYYRDDCQGPVNQHPDLISTCKARDKFCKVEHTQNHGITTKLKRSCAESCVQECRWKDMVSSILICTKCCQQNECNL